MDDDLMSLKDVAQVERWNKEDMRIGRTYATQPSITQIKQMVDSIYAAHKYKERIEELEVALKDMVDDVEEYVRINNLYDDNGRPANNDDLRRAKVVLFGSAGASSA